MNEWTTWQLFQVLTPSSPWRQGELHSSNKVWGLAVKIIILNTFKGAMAWGCYKAIWKVLDWA